MTLDKLKKKQKKTRHQHCLQQTDEEVTQGSICTGGKISAAFWTSYFLFPFYRDVKRLSRSFSHAPWYFGLGSVQACGSGAGCTDYISIHAAGCFLMFYSSGKAHCTRGVQLHLEIASDRRWSFLKHTDDTLHTKYQLYPRGKWHLVSQYNSMSCLKKWLCIVWFSMEWPLKGCWWSFPMLTLTKESCTPKRPYVGLETMSHRGIETFTMLSTWLQHNWQECIFKCQFQVCN